MDDAKRPALAKRPTVTYRTPRSYWRRNTERTARPPIRPVRSVRPVRSARSIVARRRSDRIERRAIPHSRSTRPRRRFHTVSICFPLRPYRLSEVPWIRPYSPDPGVRYPCSHRADDDARSIDGPGPRRSRKRERRRTGTGKRKASDDGSYTRTVSRLTGRLDGPSRISGVESFATDRGS